MSAGQNSPPFKKKELKDALGQMLDFGPEQSPLTQEQTDRLKRVVQQLQEINKRIDKLSEKL